MRRVTVTLMILCLWAGALLFGGSSTRLAPGLSWMVEVRYPSVAASPDESLTIRWRFTIQSGVQRADGEWWNVLVQDADGITPVTGTFLFQPERGMIREVAVREWMRGEWKELRTAGEERPVSLGEFPPLPLDFVGSDLRDPVPDTTIPAPRVRIPRISGAMSFLDEFEIHPGDTMEIARPVTGLPGAESGDRKVRRILIRDVHHPGAEWQFVWAPDFPWWLECRGPAWSARLIGIGDETR